jgi:hypothetical protein
MSSILIVTTLSDSNGRTFYILLYLSIYKRLDMNCIIHGQTTAASTMKSNLLSRYETIIHVHHSYTLLRNIMIHNESWGTHIIDIT